MVNVLWTPIQRLIGRGVEIHGVSAQSPLAKAFLIEGDALLQANGKKLKTPEDLVEQIQRNEITKVKFYRPDFEYTVEVKRENLLGGANALERLGIGSWKKSRNWRSAGFYGHYATYAEVLQLIASLVFGLLIASFLGRKFLTRRRGEVGEKTETKVTEDRRPKTKDQISPLLPFSPTPLLFFCAAAMSLALLLTVTRASQLGFLVSALAIVITCGNRKLVLSLAVVTLPIAIGGLLFLQQSRNVKFFDAKDDSTLYRVTMYRDGMRLWAENPRHFFVGVGMDSIQRYWRDWRLFDGGKLPMGHFHSTPVQLLVERGLPALLIWLWLLWTYARTLWRSLQLRITNYELWIMESGEKSAIPNTRFQIGIILGSFGGLIGFFTSGLAHYNLGDQEVAMVFFILMGLSVFLTIKNAKLKIQNNSAVRN
jgi:O-antigen ligase